MPKPPPPTPPSSGIQGLREHWRNDLMAAFSVSMVALPLSLGIALISGAPATAGLFAAMIGGFVTTFVRGSHIAVNGPGNGLIAVILMGVMSFGGGVPGQEIAAFKYVLAAIVVAGILQTCIGLLKLGKLGNIFPSSVIHGILAAIGLIILGKQVHVALGAKTAAKSTLGVLMDIPNSIMAVNPYILLVSALCLLILVVYPRIQSKTIHLLPAPMWVLILAIPLAWYLQFATAESYTLFGKVYPLSKDLMVPIPKSLLDGFLLPDFSKIWTLPFWSVVFSITLLSSIETLISIKAIDKLDPYHRETDANRELIGVGLSSVVAGCLGGLPIVTVIARSSVNINNCAHTRWSNFFQAVLLLSLLLFAPVIRMVPMAALAAILIYTGYRLSAPKVYKDAHKKGWEQLLFLLVTLFATLAYGLVPGLLSGTAFTLLFQIIRTGTSPSTFLRSLWETSFERKEEGEVVDIAPVGIVNFGNILRLQSALDGVPTKKQVSLNFAKAPLLDLTVLEYLQSLSEKFRHAGGKLQLLGTEHHQSSSSYPQALRVLGGPVITAPERPVRMSRRQREMRELADQNGWHYCLELDWDASYLKNFAFFETRPLEYKENVLSGRYEEFGVDWEIADLTFDEGAILVEEFHTTVQILFHSWDIPAFVVEREELYDRLMEYVGYEEVDLKYFTKLSSRFVVKCCNGKDVEAFFTKEHVKFFEANDIYHLESNGEALLLFRRFRLERPQGIMNMHKFGKALLEELCPNAPKIPLEEQTPQERRA